MHNTGFINGNSALPTSSPLRRRLQCQRPQRLRRRFLLIRGRAVLVDGLDTAPLQLLAQAGGLVGNCHPNLVHVEEVVLEEKLDAHTELLAIMIAV